MHANRLSVLSAATLLACGVGFAGNAQAMLSDCSTLTGDVEDQVTPNIGCQILQPLGANENDFTGGSDPSLWTVNMEEFFGFDDWLFDGKWEDPGDGTDLVEDDEDPPTLADFSGDAQSGTWGLDDVSLFSDLMFVVKDGNDTNLVGYLIDVGFVGEGDYASPFTNPPFDVNNPRDISHISIYARGEGVEIPAPGILGLMGIGLLGLFAAGARRRRD